MNKKKNEKKIILPTQTMLWLRGFIGLYLIYLAYELMRGEYGTAPSTIFILCSILFFAAGLIIVISMIRSWMKGEYVGGKADISEDEDIEFEENCNDNNGIVD